MDTNHKPMLVSFDRGNFETGVKVHKPSKTKTKIAFSFFPFDHEIVVLLNEAWL
jgi:hypothetical protein